MPDVETATLAYFDDFIKSAYHVKYAECSTHFNSYLITTYNNYRVPLELKVQNGDLLVGALVVNSVVPLADPEFEKKAKKAIFDQINKIFT